MKTNSNLSFTLYEILKEVLFGTTQTRGSLRKELENIKAHLKLSFERDKYIPLKREYIKIGSTTGLKNNLIFRYLLSFKLKHSWLRSEF
jgi:hypothetical protein